MTNNTTWHQNRIGLYNQAASDLANFSYDVVKNRGCDVSSRTTEENEQITKDLLIRQMKNLADYMQLHYQMDIT